ncbi:hydrolase [Streptomyces sp. ICBB 8177]|uniref:alpha/beta hydrolase family protein n=1 Tax=Streptomyces sp. ICBB 8177 TaxID=563922 RepID=UPI000D6820F2|nr:hydrolase [Streptomyces sp. ICBB 8177]PWI45841.1 hydrolase [Streptomyces sp. ICBB 8177]
MHSAHRRPVNPPTGRASSATTRRRLAGLGAALTVTALTATALTAAPATAATRTAVTGTSGATTGQARLTLPRPTGPDQVGTVELRLVDHSRKDPWVPSVPYRELMVSVRYPARDADRYPRAPQMLPGAAAGFDALDNFGGKIPKGKVDWAGTLSYAHEGAPVARGRGRLPVVLYSPGVGDPRTLGTTLGDELASHGYVVVTIDHTYDASAVEFPHGRVEKSVLPAALAATGGDPAKVIALLRRTVDARVADTRSVLDAVDALAAGHDPDADGRRLPRGLAGALDPHHVGMFGQSAGGMAALETMHEDPRLAAGVDMDGVLAYEQDDHTPGNPFPVARSGLRKPFMLMGEEGDDHTTVPSWGLLWEHSDGWRRDLTLLGGRHASFTDAESMVPQIARQLRLPRSTVTALVGTAGPARAVAAQEAYLTAFFDRWLRGRDSTLLDGPSPCHPQIRFAGSAGGDRAGR